MTFNASLLYALRLLKPKKNSTSNGRKSLFGAMIGIALSIVPLVGVLVVADGMIEGITGRLIGLSSYHMQVVQTIAKNLSTQEHLSLLEDIAKDIDSLDGITETFIERQGVALAVGATGRTGATVRAVDENLFSQSSGFSEYLEVIDGSAHFPNQKSSIIGKKIAETLQLNVGDTLRLISTQTLPNGRLIPKMHTSTIAGIVSSGYEEIDALWVFLPLEEGFSYLASASSQIKIGIEVADPFNTSLTKIAVDTMQSLPSGFYLYRWSDLNSSQYENYASTRMLLLLIMFLILLIAAVNISAALIMISLERQKEIAILKSIGATSKGITIAFLITGVFCAFGGLLIGLPIGLIFGLNFNEILHFCENFFNEILKLWYYISSGFEYIPISFLNPTYYLETIPVSIPTVELLYISIGTIALAIIVSIFPAHKAGKEHPLDILRKL